MDHPIQEWVICVRDMCASEDEETYADTERNLSAAVVFEIQCARSKSVCTWALAQTKRIEPPLNARAMRMMSDLIEMGADVQSGLLSAAVVSAHTSRKFENTETFCEALRLIRWTMFGVSETEWRDAYEPLVRRGLNGMNAHEMAAAVRLWAKGPMKDDAPLVASQKARKQRMRQSAFFDAFMECAPAKWLDECVCVLEMDVTRADWCERVYEKMCEHPEIKLERVEILHTAAAHHASAFPCVISSPKFVDFFAGVL